MTSASHTTRFSDPFVCPDCSARLPLQVVTCPSCGLVLRGPLASQLLQTLRTADDLLVRLRAESAGPPTVAAMPAYPVSRPLPRQVGPRGLSAPSVPKILLGLGALCLLVAAVIFLAVAWSWLGVGGRTAVLVALTLVSGGLGVWLGRRELTVAAEALTTVGLGLLALDVLGADNAGWLGDLDSAGVTCAVGATVLVAALALAMTTRLGAPQVLAVLALSVVGFGAADATGRVTTTVVIVVLGHAALVEAGRRRALVLLPVLAAVGTGWWWLALVVIALGDATSNPTLHGLWGDGDGVGLLVASLLLLLPVPFLRTQQVPTRVLAAASAAMLTVTAGLPAVDESATVLGTVALVALVAWTLVSVVTPGSWRPVPRLPMLLAALPVGVVSAGLAAQAAVNAIGDQAPFTQAAGVRLHDLDTLASPALLALGTAGLLLAAVSLVPRPAGVRPQVPVGVLLMAATGTLALFPVPAWTVVAALLLLGAGLLADAWRQDDTFGHGQALVGLGVAGLAVPVALPSDVLTAAVAAGLAAMAAVLALRGSTDELRVAGAVVLPPALAGLLWSMASVADVDQVQRGVPVLLVVGLLAIALPRIEIELAAALAALVASVGAVGAADDPSVALAVHLTVAGVLVCASALVHPDRRMLGWAGGLLLAAATWVRLADIGVTAPEPYTMPSAVALLLVGLDRLRRDPDASSVAALLPGLLLATVPSLLWVLADPLTVRAALLGAGCLLLILAGTTLRWNAPLLVGAAVGAAVVLRELAPYAAQTPQWVLIGVAGTLLTVVGITWERRLRDLRAASAYVGRLR
ncbi:MULTISPECIES: SCO7613 C-terminal domain-containing membrane protein [unclassified Nocardioides]|uniref:SCO7613 C-terminal domain-containing membrane protein n=1 Tax=unclassified Nocardioides TaxID=2615069 RepID=UPI000A26D39A|nr:MULTISPECIES: hypothetical protein [unclassified Nocardioides]